MRPQTQQQKKALPAAFLQYKHRFMHIATQKQHAQPETKDSKYQLSFFLAEKNGIPQNKKNRCQTT